MMRVLITHPGRQHSHQLAHALNQQNDLVGYWTGVPTADPATKGPLYRTLVEFSPQPATDLPDGVVTHNYIMPIARRIAERTLSPSGAAALCHRAAAWFDTWAARRLPSDIDAVVAYENAACETFRVARRQSTTTILDAASFHYEWQDAVYDPVESDAAHRRINARKEEEIQLADHILTVSSLARESYLNAGVAPDHVSSVPMGADLSDFRPNGHCRDTPFTFIFAGYADRRKGADVLLRASERLMERTGIDHQVQFAGDRDDQLFEKTSAPVEPLGYLSRPDLAEAFCRADCLVLPSRHDSFGRVVVEAMGTGLPVLLSDHVGAKEVIEQGETGWVVPVEDAEALAEQMQWCIEHSEQVQSMREVAVETAQKYSWTAYHKRAREAIASVVENH